MHYTVFQHTTEGSSFIRFSTLSDALSYARSLPSSTRYDVWIDHGTDKCALVTTSEDQLSLTIASECQA